MTKNLLFVFFLLFCSRLTFANKVDDLKTDDDVAKFIRSVDTVMIDPKYSADLKVYSTEHILSDKNCDPRAKTWGVKNWIKTDFNNDGRTDLLVTVYWSNYTNFIAIDKGDDTFTLININYSSFINCELVSLIKEGNTNLVLFHSNKPPYQKEESLSGRNVSQTDTLIYMAESFVELNRKPAKYSIDSMTFNAGPCYGSCPTVELKIDKLGHATYIAGAFAKRPGNFISMISDKDLRNILGLVNYIGVKDLYDQYAVNWTDSPTCSIRIKFTDGSVKYISDYGELGTFGLRALYDKFFKIMAKQSWVASKF